MHHRSDRPEFALRQGGAKRVGLVAHAAQRVEAPGIRDDVLALLSQDSGRVPRNAGVEQNQPTLQYRAGFEIKDDGIDVDAAVGIEPDVVHSTKRRRVLVLFSDRLLEPVDFDFARARSAGLVRRHAALARQQGVDQPHRERRRTPESAAKRRNVGKARDLQKIAGIRRTQTLPDERVLNRLDRLAVLGLRVFQHEFALEELVESQVYELVDGGADDGSISALVEIREIGTAPDKTDPERGLADDHFGTRSSSITALANASRESNSQSGAAVCRTCARHSGFPSRTALMPAARPARRSQTRSPTITQEARLSPSSRRARKTSPGAGLRQRQARRSSGTPSP